MKKKIMVAAAVLFALLMLCVGCKNPSSPENPPSGTSTQTQSGTSIVGTWTGTGGTYDGATIIFNNNSTYNLTIEGYTETGSYTVGEISVNGKYPVTIQPTGGDSFSVEQFGWDKDGDNKIYYAGGSFTKQ